MTCQRVFSSWIKNYLRLLRQNYDKDRVTNFIIFLKNFLYIKDSEINRKFDEQIIQLSGGTVDMGIIEIVKKRERQSGLKQGVKQGLEQKSYEVVRNLLATSRFTMAEIADFATVTEEFVEKVRADLSKKKQE